jgi:hypothetical protein
MQQALILLCITGVKRAVVRPGSGLLNASVTSSRQQSDLLHTASNSKRGHPSFATLIAASPATIPFLS